MAPNTRSQIQQNQASPESANENVLTQILTATQSLAHLRAATHNAVLKEV